MVAFSIWMDTHKSRSVHMSQGFYMLQSSHWHGPCTSDDTLPFGWLKKEAAAAASGFSPVWGSQFHFFQVLSLKLFLFVKSCCFFQFFALLRCKALDLVEMGGHFSVFVEHVDSCRISRLSRHDCDTSGT